MTPIIKDGSDIQPHLPPENLVNRIWQELIRATKDRHHHWRTPALASIGVDGNPQVRTIVLREANQTLWTLAVYSDSRSPKCQELLKHGRAQLVFWSPKLSWQLRVSVNAKVYGEGNVVETAWARMSQSKSSRDYLSNQAPGSDIIQDNSKDVFSSHVADNHYLVVLSLQVISMDWVELGRELHRRARIAPDGSVKPLWP